MTQIEDMLEAFVMHYGMKYTTGQRAELVGKYQWLGLAYKNAVYDEVVASHPASLRSLPDIAAIEKAMNRAGRPETYEQGQKQIEYGKVATIDQARSAVAEVKSMTGVGNEEEVRRVGVRIAKGDATKEEQHWYWCMTENGGVWKKPEEGELCCM